ncbi:MAG: O-acetylhomoserine aminocarboxypropyltransferase/cysteine synthase family protein [Clostridia bacterium]|jgi:O-acetylhomoserine (thiol)-lyase|nr:O-acetylhomoserine aminocarboxypropyltransferase/cysteine synthase [Spirochaetia bacterium]
MSNPLSFDTSAVHAGQVPDPATQSRAVPLYRTSSFTFKSVDHASRLFALKELGNIYSRLGNPTNEVLEARVSSLEGGLASISVSSGTAAVFNTIINIAKAGDEIVSASNLYGGTYSMFDGILPDFGITTRFADIRDPASVEQAIGKKTRLIYVETIGNPALDVADIPAISAVAKKHHLPLVVDGTFTTPALLRSIEQGADIVINSLTKWMGGHGTAIGGIVTDAGSFDWTDRKFELYNRPEPTYHGLRWAADLSGDLAKVPFAVRFRTVPLRNLGSCLAPDSAWQFLQGLETLHLRMPRHCDNAQAVARFLEGHSKVAWVRYPGLEKDPSHSIASRVLKKGYGGMVVFGVKGGREAGARFIEALQLFSHLANVGDAKSLALHPSSTSHSQLSDEQQKAAGLPPDLVRLSIGIEGQTDILDDLESALAKA